METKLLSAAIESRESFDKITELLSPEEMGEEVKILFRKVADYYESDDEATNVDVDLLLARLEREYPKHYELFQTVLTTLPKVSAKNLIKEIRQQKQNVIAMRLSSALLAGRKEDIHSLMEEYQHVENLDADEEVDYTQVSLKDILAVYKPENLLRIYPMDLNTHLGGGVPPQTHIIIFATPECFSQDTEILTTEGWKYVDKITEKDKVAAVTQDLSLKFENPTELICRDDFKEAYLFSNTKVNMLVSPGHRVVYTKDDRWLEDTAEEVLLYQGRKLHSIAIANGIKQWTAFDALQVAYQADGRTRVYQQTGWSGKKYCHEIKLKKQRKIDRLFNILNSLPDVDYTTWIDTKGYTGFYIKTDVQLSKDFSWIELEKVSKEFALAFCYELALWDGTVYSDTYKKYSNTNKEAVDIAQAVAVMAGYTTHIYEDNKADYRTCYQLTYRNYSPCDGGNITKELVSYTGNMYCFTVSTGMVLTRRNNAVVISGNCGKTALGITIACGAARDGHKVLYVGNEDSDSSMMTRFFSNMSNKNRLEMLTDPDAAEAIAVSKGIRNLHFVPMAEGTIKEIEKQIKKIKPQFLVVDQIRNLKIPGVDGEAELLTRAGKAMRKLTKKYNLVTVSITQASDSATGKRILTKGDVYYSNVSLPGDADILLGVGGDESDLANNRRYLSLPKNKVNNNHNSLQVIIDPLLSKMLSNS